jgi:calcium/calmodulin-dependent protein kinase I
VARLTSCAFPISDIWAIGVITYFLLCGYTPFDRDSNLEEMQAILQADYSFTPVEYWRNVSQQAREFIKRCLTIDPRLRMTAHQALQHPWIKGSLNDPTSPESEGGEDLLPTVKKNFNARRTLHRAIDTVRAINKLREGGLGHIDGAMSLDPKPNNEAVNGSRVMDAHGMPMEGVVAQGSSGPGVPENDAPPHPRQHVGGAPPHDPDAMEVDSRSDARGQTDDQIKRQERKVLETVSGMWNRNAPRS